MVKIYSLRLSAEQNAAFERFEALTSCEPFGADSILHDQAVQRHDRAD